MRILRRWASMSLPAFSKAATCSAHSFLILCIASFMVLRLVTNCLAGKKVWDSMRSMTVPRRESMVEMRSISSPKNSTDGGLVEVGGMDFDDVAADSEFTATKSDVVALEEEVDQFLEKFIAPDFLAYPDREHGILVVIGTSQTIDAGDRGHHDDVFAGEDRTHRGEAHALDLVVDGGVFLDVGVGAGDVGLGLIVVEVGDEVFDRVGGEEVFELGVELSREGLVVRHDQSRLPDVPNHVGHREGLARARDPEEGLVLVSGFDGLGELGNGLGLIAGWLIVTGKFEGHGRTFNIQRRTSNVEVKNLNRSGGLYCRWGLRSLVEAHKKHLPITTGVRRK